MVFAKILAVVDPLCQCQRPPLQVTDVQYPSVTWERLRHDPGWPLTFLGPAHSPAPTRSWEALGARAGKGRFARGRPRRRVKARLRASMPVALRGERRSTPFRRAAPRRGADENRGVYLGPRCLPRGVGMREGT
eukprot:scaffold8119_cov444-Prasinococcus_capsulatus_cf.AAC.11